MYRIRMLFAVGAGLLLASGASADPTINGAWVRAMPPTQSMTAGYLTLDNPGASVITITGATADVSPRVEIHATVSRDGMQRMQPVDTLDVPPGSSFEFAPGGYHLMLRDMPHMPAAGDSVELCLQLAGAQPVCARATVSRGAPEENSHHH